MLKLANTINSHNREKKRANKKINKNFDKAIEENNKLAKGSTLPIVQFMIDILHTNEYKEWASVENKKNKVSTPPASMNQLHAVCVGIKYGDYQISKYDFHRMNSRIGPPVVGYFPIDTPTDMIVRAVIAHWLNEAHSKNVVCAFSPPPDMADSIAPIVRDFRSPTPLYKKYRIK